VRPEGLGKLKKFIHLIGSRTSELPAPLSDVHLFPDDTKYGQSTTRIIVVVKGNLLVKRTFANAAVGWTDWLGKVYLRKEWRK
jgi:hypothetical protein